MPKTFTPYLPNTDLSQHMQTEKLLDCWYMLSNKHLSVLIETNSCRIRGIFTHGKFGRMQKLLYDTRNIDQEYWGFCPRVPRFSSQNHDLRRLDYMPSLSRSNPESVIFDAKEKLLIMRGIPLTTEAYQDEFPLEEIRIQLRGTTIHYSINYCHESWLPGMLGKYYDPPELMSSWYPLYSHFQLDTGKRQAIPYSEDSFSKVAGKTLTLSDLKGRMPEMKIHSASGRCIMTSEKDLSRKGAHRLRTTIQHPLFKDEMKITFTPNPVTLCANPYYHSGEHEIDILSKQKPTLSIGRKKVSVEKVGDEKYKALIQLKKEGTFKLIAKTSQGQSESIVCVLKDPAEAIKKIGDSGMRVFWKKGQLKRKKTSQKRL
ncbi:MAG: hypothetical protein MJH11_12715 [Lentisphaeria bacterium]|nr:hypothetical protein [Lentisphaeria bacterium]